MGRNDAIRKEKRNERVIERSKKLYIYKGDKGMKRKWEVGRVGWKRKIKEREGLKREEEFGEGETEEREGRKGQIQDDKWNKEYW